MSQTSEPLVEELVPAPEAEEVFLRWSRLPHCVFFDSARRDPKLGRYSFVAADPFEFYMCAGDDADAWQLLPERLALFPAQRMPDLPPFQGGAAGLWGYGLARSLEKLPPPRFDEFQTPGLAVGLYDVVAAFDHARNRAWIISHGWPETNPGQRLHRAFERLKRFHALTRNGASGDHDRTHRIGPLQSSVERRPIAAGELAPQFPASGPKGLTSNFSRDDYLQAVERAIDYIRAGDIFQVNLSQRLLFPAHDDSIALYRRLRARNPATFAGYLDLGPFQLASASPERFLQVCDGEVETRPIKGTRRRTARPEADLFAGDDLQASDKERSENVMIVDLLRNDLSRVCRPESVRVTQLCQLELYEHVQHLVSAVRGKLAPGIGATEVLKAAFPGGSITGAPKVRAMEIIAELEPTARGPYCGSLGYIGFDGNCDTNILIRTITAGRGWWQFPVGGGIVAQSSPAREYEETWHKAEGLVQALVE